VALRVNHSATLLALTHNATLLAIYKNSRTGSLLPEVVIPGGIFC
jgi:hypothetical protein